MINLMFNRMMPVYCLLVIISFSFGYRPLSGETTLLQDLGQAACKGSPDCQSVRELAYGTNPARDMRPGESHWYQLNLQKDQYIQILVAQQGIDVTTTICDPDRDHVMTIDDTTGDDGIDTVSLVAEKTGCYRLKVESSGDQPRPGKYEMNVSVPRPANERDRERVKAEWDFLAANVLAENQDVYSQRQAIANYERALPIFNKLSDPREALTMNGMGFVYNKLYEYEKALEYLIPAQNLLRSINDQLRQGFGLNNIGYAYDALGESGKALEFYEKALEIWRDTNNDEQEIRTRINLGDLYLLIGDYDSASEQFNRMLDKAKALVHKEYTARALLELGRVYDARKEYDTAIQHYKIALELVPEAALEIKAGILNSIAVSLGKLGKHEEALKIVEEVQSLYDRRPDEWHAQAIRYNTLGMLSYEMRDYSKAYERFQRALSIARDIRDIEITLKGLNNLANVERKLGRLLDAKASIEEALSLYEQFRLRIDGPTLRQAYFATYHTLYQFYIDLLMDLHEKEPGKGYSVAALEATERARSRSLLDFLIDAKVTIDKEVPQELADRLREAQGRLDLAIQQRRRVSREHSPSAADEVERHVREQLAERENVMKEIEAANPTLASLINPKPITLEQIRNNVLDDDTVLIEYAFGIDRAFVWAITRREFIVQPLPLPGRAAIEEGVYNVRKLLTARNCRKHNEDYDERNKRIREADSSYPAAAYKLSRQILGPIASILGNKRLVIVAEGPLQFLPFGALPDPTEPPPGGMMMKSERGTGRSFSPLLLKHEITYLPSAAAIAKLRDTVRLRTPAPKLIAVLADPVLDVTDERLRGVLNARNAPRPARGRYQADFRLRQLSGEQGCEPYLNKFQPLAGFKKEADAIIQLVPRAKAKRADGFDASLATLNSRDLQLYRTIHLATHGYIPEKNPEQTGVMLSQFTPRGEPQEGHLRLSNVYRLRLRADLVTLSACDSGLGKEIEGEGVVGLARGFMYAGTPRLAVSLWKVEDESTRKLMVQFYTAMLKHRLTPAAALREAQKYMWNQDSVKEPYFWAAFILEGEWR